MTDKDIIFELPSVTWNADRCRMFIKGLGRERVLEELKKMFTKEYAENILNIFENAK